jgi:hypothetical protein
MRGRWPDGPEYLDKLQGSVESKQRLKAILDTLCGQARMREACAQLDISETRFHHLREAAMQAAVTAIEPRPSGRPSRAASAQAEEIRVLQQRVRAGASAARVPRARRDWGHPGFSAENLQRVHVGAVISCVGWAAYGIDRFVELRQEPRAILGRHRRRPTGHDPASPEIVHQPARHTASFSFRLDARRPCTSGREAMTGRLDNAP